MKFIREDFDNFQTLLKTLDERPNNSVMHDKHSSRSGTLDFTGTKSYEEALLLLREGYTDHIPKIKQELAKNRHLNAKMYSALPHPTPKNYVAGFVPNVPNALRGLPESMITVQREPQKRKIISILYSIGGSCGRDIPYFIDAGVPLVSAINLIEMSGIQTELRISFMPAESADEIIFPTVKIKSYGERFNLQKICFPLIHPSMFRRIGFKYLETCPRLTEEGFHWGYGHVPDLETVKKNITEKDTYVIDTGWLHENDTIEEILREFEVYK